MDTPGFELGAFRSLSTLEDYDTLFSAVSPSSPLVRFQALENESNFQCFEANCYHLIDKDVCENDSRLSKYVYDENNLIITTRPFRLALDGVFVIPRGIPNILINFRGCDNNTPLQFGGIRRFQVNVGIEFANEIVRDMMLPQLKDGCSKLTELVYTVPVLVTDPETFKFCLDWKESKTRTIWEQYQADQEQKEEQFAALDEASTFISELD